MKDQYNLVFKYTILWSALLAPAFLLSTPNFSVGVIAFVVLISIGYIAKNRKQLVLGFFDGIVLLCLSLYFIGAIPITIIDGTTTRYFQGGVRLLLCIPIYISLSHYLKNSESISLRRPVEIGVILGALGTFSLAFYQFYYLKMPRVDGFLFSINFGYLACSLAFLALTLIFNSNRKVWLLIAFFLCIVSVTLSLTRGAIFAIPCLLILFLALRSKHLNKKLIALSVVVFVASSLSAYKYIPTIQQRIDFTIYEFTNIASGNINNAQSAGDRLQYWIAATEAFKKNPIIGLTYKQREQLNQELNLEGKVSERISNTSRGHAHSQYFEMLASNGVLGLISIFAIFIVPLSLFIHHYKKYDSDWSFTATVFVSGFAIFGITEVALTTNLIGSFYGFMLAVFFAIIASEKHNKPVN